MITGYQSQVDEDLKTTIPKIPEMTESVARQLKKIEVVLWD